MCVGTILPAGLLSLVMSDQRYGWQLDMPIWLSGTRLCMAHWALAGAGLQSGCLSLLRPVTVAIRGLLFLAGGSNLHHVQHWSGRFWHRFLNTGSLIFVFLWLLIYGKKLTAGTVLDNFAQRR